MYCTALSRRTLLALVLWLVSLLVPLYGQQNPPAITVDKAVWKVVFMPIEVENGPPSSLLQRIPKIFATEFTSSETHVLDSYEKEQLRRKAVKKLLYSEYSNYTSLVRQKDSLAFYSDNNSIDRRRRLESDLSKKLDYIRQLERMKLDKITLASELPLAVTDRSMKKYELPNVILRNEEYDLFIGGRARYDKGVYDTKIEAYNHVTEKTIVLWSGLLTESNFFPTMDSLRGSLNSLILGRPWASLQINSSTPVPQQVSVYLDGRLVGLDSVTFNGLRPDKEYQLELLSPGYRSKRYFLKLRPFELNVFNLQLDETVEERYINVDADAVAKVYLGVRYVGETPLSLRLPDYRTELILSSPDKRTINYDLDFQQQSDLYFRFQDLGKASLEQEYVKARKTFYLSSALFTISAALPLVGFSLGITEYGLSVWNEQTTPLAQKHLQTSYIFWAIGGLGAALTAVILGFNIADFVKYTHASKALSNLEFEVDRPSPQDVEVQQVDPSAIGASGQASPTSQGASAPAE